MKISNSKQGLARIISENGGWRDGAEYSAMDTNGMVCGYLSAPKWSTSLREWVGSGCFRMFLSKTPAPNHQRTTLFRAEYFHLYPAPDADGWIEWNGGECPVDGYCMVDYRMSATPYGYHLTNQACNLAWDGVKKPYCIIAYRLHKPEQSTVESRLADAVDIVKSAAPALMRDDMKFTGDEVMGERKPTIEQLAADYRNAKDYAERKQKEADAAKADAEDRLTELVASGKALGLALSVTEPEPELAITDWRDLQVGDEVEYLDGGVKHKIGMIGAIDKFDHNSCTDRFFRIRDGYKFGWPTKWRFIRRP